MRPAIPDELKTQRLWLTAPRLEDAPELCAAIAESFEELRRWMDWATSIPSLEEELEIVARRRAAHDDGDDLSWLMRRQPDGRLVGVGGLPRLCWERREFEIGYWVRTSAVGNGYVTEFVRCMSQLCFEHFSALRVEIRVSALNRRSRRVAELAGFRSERTLEADGTHPDGSVRDTIIYALNSGDRLEA